MCVSVSQCVPPSVTQDGGVVQRPSPIAVGLVDLSTVLQEELAGCQGILGTRELLFIYVHTHTTGDSLATFSTSSSNKTECAKPPSGP